MEYIQQKNNQEGFSFVELMIVIAIMAILAVIAVPQFLSYQKRAKLRSTVANLQAISNAIDSFNTDTGEYPSKLDDLVKKPADANIASKWMGYLKSKKIPKDSWNQSFFYSVNPAGAEHPYELYSFGAKGKKGTPKSERISVWDL
jgi:general secretion pathway protein G